MTQPVSKHQSQGQDNQLKEIDVGNDFTFAPVQIGTKIETQIIQSSATLTHRTLNKNSPYLGLKRFNFKDRECFFGRDKLITRLLKAVNRSNLSLVLGASGSGKSSVVRAGLIPELKKSLEHQTFYDFIFTPYQNPFDSLYRCLLNEEKDYSFSKAEAEIALEAQPDTLTKVISTLRKNEERWLIFVDQFEELFTICDDGDKRKNFIDSLVEVAKSGNNFVKIVLAMRSDFLEQLSSYPDLGVILNDHNIHLVTEMHPDELRQAIEQPAAKHGVVFEEGLVKQIIDEVEGQKGYLPLLQYILNLLWESECKTLNNGRPHIEDRTLNKQTYVALEGVRGALQKRVNEIYSNLNQDEQAATKQIFLKLVNIVETDSGSRAVSKRANQDEFVDELEKETLNKFIEQKLLISSNKYSSLSKLQLPNIKNLRQSATVEIVHEILLSSWDNLKGWLEEEKQAIILKNWLAGETKRWLKIREENRPKARDELLKGSRLAQIIEFRSKNNFQNIGGLRTEENQFIDASVKWEQTQEQQNKNRRRNIFVGFGIFSTICLLLAGFSVIQVIKVQDAERYRQEELTRFTWISLNPKPQKINYEECKSWLTAGFRDLYCRMKPFVDYRKLIRISGLPIFRSGPHSDSELNFNGGYEFGYYNPEFLKWIQEYAIIDPDDDNLKQQIQLAYDDKIRVVARAFYQTHQILFASPEEFEAFKEKYEVVQKEYQERLRKREVNTSMFYDNPLEFEVIKSRYLEHIQNKSVPAEGLDGVGFMLTEDCRWLADYLATKNEKSYARDDERRNYWYMAIVSGGFWARRSIDGTEKQFFEILTKLLEIYDSEWLREQESLAMKSSR